MRAIVLACVLLFAATGARAADVCPTLRTQLDAADVATRIAARACDEYMRWYRPFIDRNGRLASATVSEAETRLLDDGQNPTWLRVATYWQQSGLLPAMAMRPGASDCGYALMDRRPSPPCRAFIVDTPWSAAFISWVMSQARLPGFRRSPSHIDYVRHALQQPAQSAYDFLDPLTATPAVGDMLCYVRVSGRAYGYAGLKEVAGNSGSGLNMHCEIVVAANPGNDNTAWLVSGNVQQGVTLRLLHLNRAGQFWSLPVRTGGEAACSPDNEAGCNFNRQDWAVLLKLKSPEALARLPGADLMPVSPGLPADDEKSQCCVHCVVGSGVPRCPSQAPAPTDSDD